MQCTPFPLSEQLTAFAQFLPFLIKIQFPSLLEFTSHVIVNMEIEKGVNDSYFKSMEILFRNMEIYFGSMEIERRLNDT